MKIIKRILLIILILVAVGVIIGFLMPGMRHVERTLTVNAKPDVMFDQVNDLKKWNSWSPWHELDPNMKIEYSEPASGTGAYYIWKSEVSGVGSGKLTLLESTPPSKIKYLLEFEGMNLSSGVYTFVPEGDQTKITWTYDADLGKNPFYRIMGSMMDKMLGEFFEKGLHKMDSIGQSAPVIHIDSMMVDSTMGK